MDILPAFRVEFNGERVCAADLAVEEMPEAGAEAKVERVCEKAKAT